MAYNTQDAVNTILRLKGNWLNANAEGDTKKTAQIANEAQNYYGQMRENGDTKLADTLYNSGYDASKKYVNDYFAQSGKSAIRPYFYGLGSKYGLSQSDIDNALQYNDTTGEVSLGGKNIGKPSAVGSNGVSYWDNSTLDNAFKNYVQDTGKSQTTSSLVGQQQSNLFDHYNDLMKTNTQDYNDYMNLVKANPFSTDEAKAILGKYNLSAIQGRNNQLALGTASNGGNVDSYSAANAMRQQAALYSQAQQNVLDAYNAKVQNAYNSTQKIEQARKILSDMGVQIDNAFNRDETAKNNEVQRNETVLNGKVSRDATTAQVTGQIPKSMQYSSNPFFDDNGNPIEDIDYKKVIEQAIARGDTQTAQAARVARGVKIWNNYSKYGQYDDGDYGVPNTQTEDARQFDAELKNSKDIAQMGYDHEERMPGIEADNTIRINNNQADNTIRVNDASAKNEMAVANNASKNTIAEKTSEINNTVNAYKQTDGALGGNAGNNSTASSSNSSKSSKNGSQVNGITKEFFDSWIQRNNNAAQEMGKKDMFIVNADGTYKINPAIPDNYKKVLTMNTANTDGLTDEQRIDLLHSVGLTDDDIYNAGSLIK
jgi:hypothetical protein